MQEFGPHMPDKFENIGLTLFTLFYMMVGEFGDIYEVRRRERSSGRRFAPSPIMCTVSG